MIFGSTKDNYLRRLSYLGFQIPVSKAFIMHDFQPLQQLCRYHSRIFFLQILTDKFIQRSQRKIFHRQENIVFILKPPQEFNKKLALCELRPRKFCQSKQLLFVIDLGPIHKVLLQQLNCPTLYRLSILVSTLLIYELLKTYNPKCARTQVGLLRNPLVYDSNLGDAASTICSIGGV